jgi:aldose 1-epimerase
MQHKAFVPIQLTNTRGFTLECIPFGATLTRLQIPDRNGTLVDVLVGLVHERDYGTDAYRERNWCLGATIGPYAGRIGGGGFTLDQHFFQLKGKNGIHLHGEDAGWQYKHWEVCEYDPKSQVVSFSLNTVAGEGGYPASVSAKVTYQLGHDFIEIRYSATCDAPTVLNLTNHAYFNPSGENGIQGQLLCLDSDEYLLTDAGLVPTGAKEAVADSPFDYRECREFEPHHPMDHCFVLKRSQQVATVYSSQSGIKISVDTDQPGLVVFTPRRLDGVKLRNAMEKMAFPAICLECQGFPDAPNHANFPSTRLVPGQTYQQTTRYSFSVD